MTYVLTYLALSFALAAAWALVCYRTNNARHSGARPTDPEDQ